MAQNEIIDFFKSISKSELLKYYSVEEISTKVNNRASNIARGCIILTRYNLLEKVMVKHKSRNIACYRYIGDK